MVTPGMSERPPRLRWWRFAQALLWSAIGLGAFLLLAESVQNSFGIRPPCSPGSCWSTSAAVIVLSVLLARKTVAMVRDYRAHVPGSRLTARTVGICSGGLASGSAAADRVSVVLEFINRGIDSWFKVEVKQGLNDALGLFARGARPARA